MAEDKMDELFDDKPVVAAEPVVSEPAVTGEPEATPPVAQPKSDPIPIQALLDEREKRQRIEREMEDLRGKLSEYEGKRQPPPDIMEDPEGRLTFERQAIQRVLINNKLEQSRWFAEKDFGKEVVDDAMKYYDENPQLSHQFLSAPSPLHAAVEFYKRQKVADEVGLDPVAYRERLRAELLAEIQAQGGAQPTVAAKPKLPGSLAAAPAAGKASSESPTSDGFSAAFG